MRSQPIENRGTEAHPLYFSHYQLRPLADIWSRVSEKRIQYEPNTGCWLWMGTTTRQGYPLMKLNEREVRVTRVSLATFKGASLSRVDWLACHTCDVKCCVNPDHLYAGTQSSNMLDLYGHGGKVPAYRTHCAQGHEFTPENTSMDYSARARGKKRCLACGRARQKAYLARRRAA